LPRFAAGLGENRFNCRGHGLQSALRASVSDHRVARLEQNGAARINERGGYFCAAYIHADCEFV
jgi:hypothetical protein